MTLSRRHSPAFTLLEILVACAVLLVMLVLILTMVNQTTDIWRRNNARIEQFQNARVAFETLTHYLSQATLNTYYDYDDASHPTKYQRTSQLHFLVEDAGTGNLPGTPGTGQAVFFQAPANKAAASQYEGLSGLLNAMGFYIEYGSNEDWLPSHVDASQAQERFRLVLWLQNTEDLSVYGQSGSLWIIHEESNEYPLAENIIALVIWPKEEGNSPTSLNAYYYDSRNDSRSAAINQLPPALQVSMVAIDEASAVRLGNHLESVIQACLNGLFNSTPGALTGDGSTNYYTQDLKTLEQRLSEEGINYRTFTTTIPMREAKWSPSS